MSSGRFSPITSVLLARKGEARPWSQAATAEAENVASIPWRSLSPAVVTRSSPDKDRTCSIRLSARDFERLGILAVKKNVTRQQLLKEAVAEFLAAKALEYGCACLNNSEGRCGKDCGTDA